MALFDGLEISRDTLEQANPVFNTAKMTLFQLSGTGDADAAAISEKLGLTMERWRTDRLGSLFRPDSVLC